MRRPIFKWADTLERRALVQAISRSRTARMLAGSVLIALMCAQLVLIIPSLWLQHQDRLRSVAGTERHLLQMAVRHAAPDELVYQQVPFSPAVLGVQLTDASGRIVYGFGALAEAAGTPSDATAVLPSASWRWSHSVQWSVKTRSGTLNANVWLDTSDVMVDSVVATIRQLTLALLASFTGTVIALMGILRFYVLPLGALGNTLRQLRKDNAEDVPAAIDMPESDDLLPLAKEFNLLLDAQRKNQRQIKVKQQYLEFAAHHDPLTHLPNRLMFEDTLKSTVAQAREQDDQFAVFLVDVDNFKFFNDQYGNLVGDKMVAELGNRLRRMIRNNDLVARLDGDEFVVIQKGVADRSAAEAIAGRIMELVKTPFIFRGFTLKVAVSVGISCYPMDVHGEQDDQVSGEEIVNNAAVALGHAKRNGRNRYQLFDESMRSDLVARIRLEEDLKSALLNGEFEVHYQPKIDMQTRQITGAEALVRWPHPTRGFISPEAFVPVAEDAGMIIELGEWILNTACEQTRSLHEQGFANLGVAVNISAVQFTDGNLLPMVNKALKDSQLQPGLLELEITESAVMHDPEEVIKSLHELGRFGIRLAIDDFGTGYSSLAYLKRFPVDTLKIDRAFITDISSDNDDVAIVEAVLGLGKHFNMKVIAEGVEDEQQLQFLRQQGCDVAQGYFIGKPMPMDEYREWLQLWPHGIKPAPDADDLPRVANLD